MDAVFAVFKDIAGFRCTADPLCCKEKNIRCRFAMFNLFAADNCIKIFSHSCQFQITFYLFRITAACHCKVHTLLTKSFYDSLCTRFLRHIHLKFLPHPLHALFHNDASVGNSIMLLDHPAHMCTAGSTDIANKISPKSHTILCCQFIPCFLIDVLCIEQQTIHVKNRTFHFHLLSSAFYFPVLLSFRFSGCPVYKTRSAQRL